MKASQIAWTVVGVVTAAAVATTAGVGVAVHNEYRDLNHGQPPAVPAVQPLLTQLELADVNLADLRAALDAAADSPALGTFGAQVIDTSSGEVVWQRNDSTPLIPASSTKVLTAAAALLTVPETHTLRTEVMRAPGSSVVVIKAAGDVWMTAEQMDDLATQVTAVAGDGVIDTVFIDTSAWTGPAQGAQWDPDNVSAGFVAPLQPAMLYGGRLGATTGDVPRSYTPALDVAAALASRLKAPNVGTGPVPEGAQPVAAVESAPLALRLEQMMKHSDNVAAEAIAREAAQARGEEASFAGTTSATLDTLRTAGFPVEGVSIADNSGLSASNRIPVTVLNALIAGAARGTQLRPLLGDLPVAGGEGTLEHRYTDLPGRGFVRAKTGTLTGVSALTGTALGQSGHLYAFTILVNNADVLSARAAQDNFASTLRAF